MKAAARFPKKTKKRILITMIYVHTGLNAMLPLRKTCINKYIIITCIINRFVLKRFWGFGNKTSICFGIITDLVRNYLRYHEKSF